MNMAKQNRQWIDEIVEAYEFYGGTATYPEIFAYIEQNTTRKLTSNFQNVVRFYVETHSSDSEAYRRENENLFYSVKGLGKGIWGLRAYCRKKKPPFNRVNPVTVLGDLRHEKDDDTSYVNNTRCQMRNVSTKYYERHPVYRINAIRTHGPKCQICGFDFFEQYGKAGKDFIEVHHIIPKNGLSKGMDIDLEKDLIPVCANCHRMIHRYGGGRDAVRKIKRAVDRRK